MEKTDSEIIQEIVFGAIKSGKYPSLPECLYHYTTFALWQMLVSGHADFCCTDFLVLNDSREYVFGLERLSSGLQSNREISEEDRLALEHSFKDLYPDFKKAAWYGVWSPWIFSLSAEKDSLHQWIAYTDRTEGGVAIGLSRQKVEQCLNDLHSKYSALACACNCCLVPCIYVDDKLRFWCEDNEISIWDVFEGLIQALGNGDYQKGFERSLLLLSAMIKHSSFSCDHEWRVIIQTDSPEILRHAAVVGGKLRIPFLMHGTQQLRDVISDIVSAPHASVMDARRNILLPKVQNEGWNYGVSPSALSYRSL